VKIWINEIYEQNIELLYCKDKWIPSSLKNIKI